MAQPTELARLAAAVAILRPDWPERSIRTYLDTTHAHRPIFDLTVALVWVATDPLTTTPKRLDTAGPWWRATQTPESTPSPDRFDPSALYPTRPASREHVAAAAASVRAALTKEPAAKEQG